MAAINFAKLSDKFIDTACYFGLLYGMLQTGLARPADPQESTDPLPYSKESIREWTQKTVKSRTVLWKLTNPLRSFAKDAGIKTPHLDALARIITPARVGILPKSPVVDLIVDRAVNEVGLLAVKLRNPQTKLADAQNTNAVVEETTVAKAPKRSPRRKFPKYSEIGYEAQVILEELVRLQAFYEENREKRETVVKKAFPEEAQRRKQYNRHFSWLSEKKITASKAGRCGGIWLTPDGRLYAEARDLKE